MTFNEALKIAQAGLDAWKAKPHNARWWKRIDGTPIQNDLLVNIAEAFALAPPPPGGVGEGWTDEQVEKMARARHEALRKHDSHGIPWDEMTDQRRARQLIGMRAALSVPAPPLGGGGKE